MCIKKFFQIVIISILFFSCSKNTNKVSVIEEKSLDLQVLDAYKVGMESLKNGDVLFAAKKFNEAEMLYPQSEWAPKSSLMAAYSFYSQDYYEDAILEVGKLNLVNGNKNGVSIKISALCASYETKKYEDIKSNLVPRLIALTELC